MALDAGGISAIVFAGLFALVTILLGVKTYGTGQPADTSWILEFFTKLVLYSPYSLLAFGWLFDLASGFYDATKSGITGIVGMFINKYLIGGIINSIVFLFKSYSGTSAQSGGAWWQWVGDISELAADSSKCSIPGIPLAFESTYAPQAIVLSMTILFYIILGQYDNGWFTKSIGILIVTGLLFITQWITMYANGCLTDSVVGVFSPLVALILGAGFAASSFYIQKLLVNPAMETFIVNGLSIPQLNTTQKDGTTIINVGGKNKQTDPVNDQDQFVCEAYRDGELVTSSIVG